MKTARLLLLLAAWCVHAGEAPRFGGELRFCLRADPRTFDSLLVDEDSGETIRYLTGGVLLRINRRTQELEPELARSWTVSENGRRVEFALRPGLRYSDGAPLDAADVVATIRRLMDPALHAPTADAFRTGAGPVTVAAPAAGRVVILFPRPLAGVARLFDQVAIAGARAVALAGEPQRMPVLGPYRIAEYRAGAFVRLERNPYYWKTEAGGRLPYLDSLRLSIQQNRDLETLRFLRGELDLIQRMDPDSFERVARQMPAAAVDAGPSLESEQMWFNQAAAAPIAEHRKRWFRLREFRRAISEAIGRADLCRVVYRGRALPAAGPVSPANRFWANAKLAPHPYDPRAALGRLARLGFRPSNGLLRDAQGRPLEFSLITNAGNKTRERMAAMIQQDLARIGVRVNVVALDFASLLERITRTLDYEACLLGLTNVDLDPNGQMNVWLSSADNHQWNPRQKTPETAWEAEIDRLMRAQAAEIAPAGRKACFDRVQEIVWEEAPFLYLVHPHALAAVSPRLRNASPAALRPQVYWNIERLYLAAGGRR